MVSAHPGTQVEAVSSCLIPLAALGMYRLGCFWLQEQKTPCGEMKENLLARVEEFRSRQGVLPQLPASWDPDSVALHISALCSGVCRLCLRAAFPPEKCSSCGGSRPHAHVPCMPRDLEGEEKGFFLIGP